MAKDDDLPNLEFHVLNDAEAEAAIGDMKHAFESLGVKVTVYAIREAQTPTVDPDLN